MYMYIGPTDTDNMDIASDSFVKAVGKPSYESSSSAFLEFKDLYKLAKSVNPNIKNFQRAITFCFQAVCHITMPVHTFGQGSVL